MSIDGGPTGINFSIDGDLGQLRGSNLYHSFERFQIPSGGSATFERGDSPQWNNASVENLIARVTGSTRSELLGRLQSTVGEARLVLINPNGLVFGRGFEIDVPGSFYASTADRLEARDPMLFFSASDLDGSTFTSEVPDSFRFQSRSVAPISSSGFMEVRPGFDIALIGGDITITGDLNSSSSQGLISALDGNVSLVAVSSPGRVGGMFDGGDQITVSGFDVRADVEILDDAVISSQGVTPFYRPIGAPGFSPPANLAGRYFDASRESQRLARVELAASPDEILPQDLVVGTHRTTGAAIVLRPQTRGAEGSGRIQVVARNVSIVDSDLRSVTAGDGDGGDISIDSTGRLSIVKERRQQDVGLLARTGLTIEGGLDVLVQEQDGGDNQRIVETDLRMLIGGSGRGGDVKITAGDVDVAGGAVISATSFGEGVAGDVKIEFDSDLTLSGSDTGIFSNAQGIGAGGEINVYSPDGRMRLQEGAAITSQTTRDAHAGNIEILVESLEVLDGSTIDSSTSAQSIAPGQGGTRGDAGSITIVASERVQLAGFSLSGESSKITSRSLEGSLGAAGTVGITAPLIEISDGATVSTATEGSGLGGEVRLSGETLRLTTGGSISASTFGSGAGGDIRLDVGRLEMASSAQVSATSDFDFSNSLQDPADLGAAGQIEIGRKNETHRLSNLTLRDDSEISTTATIGTDSNSSETGIGGSITINNSGRVELNDTSRITASVGQNRGGDIVIEHPNAVVLRDQSAILAESFGDSGNGVGGSITISSGALFRSPLSEISADSDEGVDGQVLLTSSIAKLEEDLRPVNAELLDADSLIRPACEARAFGAGGSLTINPLAPQPITEDDRLSAEALLENQSRRTSRFRDQQAGFERIDDAIDLKVSGNIVGARASYSDLASDLEGSENILELAIVSSEWARLEAEAGAVDQCIRQLTRARRLVQALDNVLETWALRLHLAATQQKLADRLASGREKWIELARQDLEDAARVGALIDSPRAYSAAVGRLAMLYEHEGYVDDALGLVQEAITSIEGVEASSEAHLWHSMEGRLLRSNGRVRASLEAHRRSVDAANQLRRSTLGDRRYPQGVMHDSIGRIYREYLDALFQSTDLVEDDSARQLIYSEIRRVAENAQAIDLEDYFRDECIAGLEARERSLDQLLTDYGQGVAALYPIGFEDRLELLLVTSSGMRRKTSHVSAVQLDEAVHRFRLDLMDPLTRRHLRSASNLYDWVVRPLEEALEAEKIETLIWIPEGPLRSIPPAALHDGHRYLIERLAIASAPGAGTIEPRPLDLGHSRILLAGMSGGDSQRGFAPLPRVTEELRSIQAQFGGALLIDGDFIVDRLARRILEDDPTIIHIASHARITGDAESSFILAHDGGLSLSKLAEMVAPTRYRSQPIDLLVLSACETAVDDDQAALGLAGMAVRAGATSAIGTLWPISDGDSSELILSFYDHLAQPATAKAEALRRAQIDSIRDDARAHPFYWAAFLMVSSWL